MYSPVRIGQNVWLVELACEEMKNGSMPSKALQKQFAAIEKKYKGTTQWLKAPNGKNSNLNDIQWVMVRTSQFIQWYGDWINNPAAASKLLDENGEPKIYYHQTANTFGIFDIKHGGVGTSDYGAPNGNTAKVRPGWIKQKDSSI